MRVLFFLLFPALLSAQTVLTKDTTYQTNANGKFYNVREVEYSNGESSVVTTLVGDTATVLENALQRMISEGTRMANDAREVSRFDNIINRMVQEANFILASTGRDVLDTLTAKYSGALLIDGWSILDTLERDIAFNVSANGQLRYLITGFQARNAAIFANTMRLTNYKSTGTNLDLYKATNGNWFSLDGRIKVRFPGNPDSISNKANRSAAPPPAEPAAPSTTKKRIKKQ